MKTKRIVPEARRMVNNLRDLGYSFKTAVADIVDNSIAAGANQVEINVMPREGSRDAFVSIADNGCGMDNEDLFRAMRFGSDKKYSEKDLGKYGLGLKTASISQSRMLIVASKTEKTKFKRSTISRLAWDLDHIDKMNEWEVLVPSSSELKPWLENSISTHLAQGNGTIVIWTKLEREARGIDSKGQADRDNVLKDLLVELEFHLRMVFHKFMENRVQGFRKLKITLNGKSLDSWDPYCLDQGTTQLAPKELDVHLKTENGIEINGTISLVPHILPHESEFSTKDRWKDASGPDKWNNQQGFYFYRNGRMIQSGGWSNMRSKNEHTKLARISIDLKSELDEAFGINITKMKAHFPLELREKVRDYAQNWAMKAQRRYDSQGGKKKETVTSSKEARQDRIVKSLGIALSSGSKGDKKNSATMVGSKGNKLEIEIATGSSLSKVFVERGGHSGEMRKMVAALTAVLRLVADGYLKPNSKKVWNTIKMAEREL